MTKRILFFIGLLLAASPSFAGGGATMMMAGGGPPAGGGACTASYGSELNTTQTASSPVGITEADATTGWASGSLGTFASSETAPSLGTSHMDFVANGNSQYAAYALTGLGLVDNTVYRLAMDVRHNGTGGVWRCGLGDAAAAGTTAAYWSFASTDTTYQTNIFNFVYNTREDTIICHESSASNDGGVYVDNVSIKAATLCYGSELNTAANAAAPGASEANATTGINNINTLNSLSSVSTGTPQNGTYHIVADATTNPAANNGFNIDLAAAPFSLQDGTKYMIRFYMKHIGAGDTWRCGHSSTSTGVADTARYHAGLLNSVTAYVEYGWQLTYAATFRYFVCTEAGSNNNGGLYLDNFSVKAVTAE